VNRREAIAHIRNRLVATGYPRVMILAILMLSGAAAFLFSAAALTAGIERMALRYPLAALVGYSVFLLLIRVWISWKRGDLHGDVPGDLLLDLPLPSVPDADVNPGSVLFAGGRSGGGGGGAAWDSSGAAARSPELSDAFDVDAGELWPAIAVAVGVLAGALALAYTVYIAPVLLAEVLFDAAVVTAFYRHLRTGDKTHWARSLIRRTWIPAASLAVFLMLAGFGLQRLAPSAHSIGAVLRALASAS
jgi:hypothetical protein